MSARRSAQADERQRLLAIAERSPAQRLPLGWAVEGGRQADERQRLLANAERSPQRIENVMWAERDLTRVLTQFVQDVHLSDEARRRIRLAAKEEQPVKMKKFVAIVLAVMLMLSATAAIAEELGLFDFLARTMGQTVLPGANELVKTDVAYGETEHAAYHVRQAVYDGKSAAIMFDIKPKSEKTMLLDETWWPEEDLMAWLKPELGDSTQTIAEYAEEHGLTIVYATVRQEPMDECPVIDEWNDGHCCVPSMQRETRFR